MCFNPLGWIYTELQLPYELEFLDFFDIIEFSSYYCFLENSDCELMESFPMLWLSNCTFSLD